MILSHVNRPTILIGFNIIAGAQDYAVPGGRDDEREEA
jgi:hypothetical protein